MLDTLTDAIPVLTAAGFTCRIRSGAESRLYPKYDGSDAGYITAADLSGSTGTCGKVTRRAGSVAAALRGAP